MSFESLLITVERRVKIGVLPTPEFQSAGIQRQPSSAHGSIVPLLLGSGDLVGVLLSLRSLSPRFCNLKSGGQFLSQSSGPVGLRIGQCSGRLLSFRGSYQFLGIAGGFNRKICRHHRADHQGESDRCAEAGDDCIAASSALRSRRGTDRPCLDRFAMQKRSSSSANSYAVLMQCVRCRKVSNLAHRKRYAGRVFRICRSAQDIVDSNDR